MASQDIRNCVLGFLLLALTSRTYGLAISYCSPDLTAGSFQAVGNQWQSNGACQTTCQGSYAYAVIQGQNCWCSDYAPANQVSTYSCSTPCPGFPNEWCGNADTGLYGYFQLDGKSPKGTSGGSGTTRSVSNTPTSAGSFPVPFSGSNFGGFSSLTVIATMQTSSRTSVVTADRTSSVSKVVSTSATGATASTSTRSSPTEVLTSLVTVTNGQVKTIIVTPTPTGSDSTLGSGSTINSSGGGGVNTGTVVGIVLGVALGLGLLIGLGVFFCLRRRHRRNMEAASIDSSSAHGNTSIPSRQVSQMSSAGLLGKAPRIQTSGLSSITDPRSADTPGSAYDRRSLGTDQRLNPYAIYAHDESRHSNLSLQDNQDYSRQLRVANPDP